MIAMEVINNGRKLCLAGAEEIEPGDVETLKFVEADKADAPVEARDPRSPAGGREHFNALEQQYPSSLKKFRK
jgi:hypothetical protein